MGLIRFLGDNTVCWVVSRIHGCWRTNPTFGLQLHKCRSSCYSWLFLLLYIRGHVDQDQTKIKNWTKTKMTFLENRTILKYKKDIEPHIIKLFILGGWHSGPSSSFRCSKTYILFWQLVMLVFFTHYLTVWIILILYQRVRDQIDTFEKLMTQLTFNLKIRN